MLERSSNSSLSFVKTCSDTSLSKWGRFLLDFGSERRKRDNCIASKVGSETLSKRDGRVFESREVSRGEKEGGLSVRRVWFSGLK